MSVWTNFVFNCLCFVYCWPGQAAIDICHFSKKKSTFILFSGGLLHWGAPVLQLPAADERDDAQVEQHLDRSHGYSQAPHLLLLLPEPDQVRTSSKTEEENLFTRFALLGLLPMLLLIILNIRVFSAIQASPDCGNLNYKVRFQSSFLVFAHTKEMQTYLWFSLSIS